MIAHIIKGLVWLFGLIALALILSDCTKEPTCINASFVIERYTLDTVLTRKTVWWEDPCYTEGKQFPGPVWYRCEPEGWIEKYYYTINGREVI